MGKGRACRSKPWKVNSLAVSQCWKKMCVTSQFLEKLRRAAWALLALQLVLAPSLVCAHLAAPANNNCLSSPNLSDTGAGAGGSGWGGIGGLLADEANYCAAGRDGPAAAEDPCACDGSVSVGLRVTPADLPRHETGIQYSTAMENLITHQNEPEIA